MRDHHIAPAEGGAARLAKTLVIGAIGGGIFYYFKLPLAWMLGAMVLATVAALSGVRLHVPQRLRSVMVMVLGVLLGSTFTPEALDRASEWPLTLACLGLYLMLATGVLYTYFARVLGFDPVTAYFCATPGGLNEMVIAGGAAGGDERTIALVHGARVLLVVLVIPFWFRVSEGVSGTTAPLTLAATDLALRDLALLLLCIPVGVVIGRTLRLPAYRLVGPMLVSGLVHVLGLTASSPPPQIVALAQIVVGASVGARFAGVALDRVLRTLAASIGSTTLVLLITLAFAFVLAWQTDLARAPLVLAYSPGGLTEMSLVALALGIETAFVATHHVARIAMIVIAAPLAFRLFSRRGTDAAPEAGD